MSVKPIQTAVLGIGNSANTFQIPFILAQPELFKLHTIMERQATAEKSKARDLYGHLGVKVVNTVEDVVKDPEVELVVVAVKNDGHFPYAKAALSAGKHVILEKPVTATAAEVRELIAISKEKKVVFAPYHNRRFDGDFRTVRQMIKDGRLHDLRDFESRYDVYATWGGGFVPGGSAGTTYGLGSHVVDQAVALFGQPTSVFAVRANARDYGHPDVDDSFTMILRYADKPVIVTLRAALHSMVSHNIRFIVRGLHNSFVKYGLDLQEPQTQSGMKPFDKGFGVDTEDLWGEYGYLKDGKPVFEKVPTLPGLYIEYYKNVGETIRGKAKLEVTPEDAELGIRIIEAAKQSTRENKAIEL